MSETRPRTFWATVTWPRQQLAVVLIVSAVIGGWAGFRHGGTLYGYSYGLVAITVLSSVAVAFWGLCRVLKAWVAWPSRTRLARWIKAVAQFLLVGPGE
jgi:hypothetical protein